MKILRGKKILSVSPPPAMAVRTAAIAEIGHASRIVIGTGPLGHDRLQGRDIAAQRTAAADQEVISRISAERVNAEATDQHVSACTAAQ